MISYHLIIQNKPTDDKIKNLERVQSLINKQFESRVNFIILSEFFNCPYGIKYIPLYAEELIPNNLNPTVKMLYDLSIKYTNVYIIGGSIPEIREGKYYNTCTIWLNGEMICLYSKIHLFDINSKNLSCKIFKESQILNAGSKPTYFDTKYGRIGLGICYDIRFNFLSNYYLDNSCDIIIYPFTFSEITGQLHIELLLRARAVDSQCWTIGVTSARDHITDYNSFGQSFIVNPYGSVEVTSIKQIENTFIHKINLEHNKYFKNMIPLDENKKNII